MPITKHSLNRLVSNLLNIADERENKMHESIERDNDGSYLVDADQKEVHTNAESNTDIDMRQEEDPMTTFTSVMLSVLDDDDDDDEISDDDMANLTSVESEICDEDEDSAELARQACIALHETSTSEIACECDKFDGEDNTGFDDFDAEDEKLPEEVENIINEHHKPAKMPRPGVVVDPTRPPINIIIDDSDPRAVTEEPDDVTDAMLIDIDDIAESDEEKEALRGGAGSVMLSVGEVVADKNEASYYAEQLDRRTVSNLYDKQAEPAMRRAMHRNEVSDIGDSETEYNTLPCEPMPNRGNQCNESTDAKPEELRVPTYVASDKRGETKIYRSAKDIGRVSNVPAIFDVSGQEIRLGDRMAYGTCYNLLGEVVGIGRNCFFTVHLEEGADGAPTYVADQWILDGNPEDGGHFYHYVEDNLTYIIDDIMDESISLEELAGRFRDVAKAMRSKKGISHQQYLHSLQHNAQL